MHPRPIDGLDGDVRPVELPVGGLHGDLHLDGEALGAQVQPVQDPLADEPEAALAVLPHHAGDAAQGPAAQGIGAPAPGGDAGPVQAPGADEKVRLGVDGEVVQEALQVRWIMLPVRIQEQVEVEGIPPQMGEASPQGLALAAALAGLQSQHLGPCRRRHGAGAITGAVVHHQHPMEPEGPQACKDRGDVVRLIVGGDDRGDLHGRPDRLAATAG